MTRAHSKSLRETEQRHSYISHEVLWSAMRPRIAFDRSSETRTSRRVAFSESQRSAFAHS
jgi:hypothetical protein